MFFFLKKKLGQIAQGENSDFEFPTLTLVKNFTGTGLLENIVDVSNSY